MVLRTVLRFIARSYKLRKSEFSREECHTRATLVGGFLHTYSHSLTLVITNGHRESYPHFPKEKSEFFVPKTHSRRAFLRNDRERRVSKSQSSQPPSRRQSIDRSEIMTVAKSESNLDNSQNSRQHEKSLRP